MAAAADAAIASLCAACGYSGGLGQLISENADYVVDGVCARLRALDANPRCNAETRCDCARGFDDGATPSTCHPRAPRQTCLSCKCRMPAPGHPSPFARGLW